MRSPTKTSGSQSNQAVVGCSRAYLRMDRFISLLTLSTCPLASGRPLDTNRNVIPSSSQSALNAPINSRPESQRNHLGFPNLGIISRYNQSSKVDDRLSRNGIISTHLLKQSTAITQWRYPSHSGSKFVIRSMDHPSPGARGLSFGRNAVYC